MIETFYTYYHLKLEIYLDIFRKGSGGLFQKQFASISEIQHWKEFGVVIQVFKKPNVKSLQIIHFFRNSIFCMNFLRTIISKLVFHS